MFDDVTVIGADRAGSAIACASAHAGWGRYVGEVRDGPFPGQRHT